MQIIDHYIDSIEVTSAQSSWPIENVLDEFAMNYWKAIDNVQSATIELHMPDVSPYCNALYVGYTSASIATLQVWDANESSQLIAERTIFLVPINFFTFLHQKRILATREAFEDWINQNQQCVLKLILETTQITDLVITNAGSGYDAGYLTATSGNGDKFRGTYTVNDVGEIDSVTITNPGIGYTNFGSATPTIVISDTGGSGAVITPQSTINAGIVRAGYSKEFGNPKFGFSETKKNFGQQIEYVDGTIQSIHGRVRREFKVSITTSLDEEYNIKEILEKGLREPLAFDLLSGESRGVVFGWITSEPSYTRNSLSRLTVTFTVREV